MNSIKQISEGTKLELNQYRFTIIPRFVNVIHPS